MDERQLKGLRYNYDDKKNSRHKCKKHNIFMVISEDVSDEEVEAPLLVDLLEPTNITPPSSPPVLESVISLNSLTGFSSPQNLKLIGYIKH